MSATGVETRASRPPRFFGTISAAVDPLKFFTTLQARYGDFIHYRGVVEFYLVNDPETVHHVLATSNRWYDKNTPLYRPMKDVLGRGLLTSEGAHWTQQRRLMQPLFTPAAVRGLGPAMLGPIEAMVERWKPIAASGRTFDVCAEMMLLTLDISSRYMFSTPLGGATDALREWYSVFSEYFMRLPVPLWSEPWMPTPLNLRLRRTLKKFQGFVRDVIAQRQRAGATEKDDLLGRLLVAYDEGSGARMSEADLIDEVLTLILAGYETTSHALTWTWYYLSQHPEAVERLQAEVDRELGDRLPTADDLPRLTFTRAVTEEAMRLRPSVWIMTRAALEEDVLLGTRMRPGTMVAFCPILLHRDPRQWDDPEAFRPERFLSEAKRPRGSYLPFGAGPRVCLGAQFATQAMILTVSTVVRRFELTLSPEYRDELHASATLTPKYGLPMTVRARPSAGVLASARPA